MNSLRQISIRNDNPHAAAAHYLGALAHHEDHAAFDRFIDIVIACATNRRTLNRSAIRALDRTYDEIYTIRYYAAMVAHLTAQCVTRPPSGSSLQVLLADDLTVRKVQQQIAPRFPKYRDWPNFCTHVWRPSKPVLHLGIAFALHALAGGDRPLPLLPLIKLGHLWAPAAAKAAQFQAVRLCKRIGTLGLGDLLEVDTGEVNMNAVAAKLLPDVVYKRQPEGNAEFQALRDD